MSTDLSRVMLCITDEHPCSYLPEVRATTAFVDPQCPLTIEVYAPLLALGFRRSGDFLYRPHCRLCQACIPARVPVADFSPSHQQARVWQRNQDLDVQIVAPYFSDELYALFADYICTRHQDGDMYPPNPTDFRKFLLFERDFCKFIEFRLNGKLLAVAATDVLSTGFSAVYTFFDPHESSRSLGRFAILWQLAEAKRRQLPALYLGYLIRDCRKMRYKTEYRPLELYINQRWVLMN